MSIVNKKTLIHLGVTVLGTMVGCMVAPKVMKMFTKAEPTIVVPPVIEGDAV